MSNSCLRFVILGIVAISCIITLNFDSVVATDVENKAIQDADLCKMQATLKKKLDALGIVPHNNAFPNDPYWPLVTIIHETTMPLFIENNYPTVPNSEFFIWRTQLSLRYTQIDEMQQEGKVYHLNDLINNNDLPKHYNNCKSIIKPISINMIIVDKNGKVIFNPLETDQVK